MTSRRTLHVLLLVAIFPIGEWAWAGEWHQSVSLPATLENDSNPTLASANDKSVSRLVFTPVYSLVGTLGADELKASLGLRVERSSNRNISANREHPNLQLGWQHQTTTGGYGIAAKFDEASTRATELEEQGRVVKDGLRRTQAVTGNWRTALSERSSLAADAEYKVVTYDGGAQTNFDNLSAGITWGHSWSERIEPFIRIGASHYEPKSALVTASDNYTLTGGVKLQASDRMEWTAQAGPSRVSGRSSETDWQGSIVMRYLGTRHDLALDIGRSISASGEGGFVGSDQVKGTWGYAIDERSRAGLETSRRDNKGVIPNTMRQLGAWASHELSPFWNARISVQHKQRQQSGQPDASSNLFGVTLVYSHPDF